MWVLVIALILVLAFRFGLEDFLTRNRPYRHIPQSREERKANLQAEEDAAYREMRERQNGWYKRVPRRFS